MADATSDREHSGDEGGRGDATVRTFLLADVRGYTRYTREKGDEAASQLAHRLAGLVGSTVPEFGGELLEVRGDETLCVFASARQALRAAVEVQRRLRAPPDDEPFPLGVGMGLDAGEAVPTDGGYRGAALNMAGRLVAAAGPGQILATERLVGLASVVDGVRWSDAKPRRLKGLDRPERVVEIEPTEPLQPPPSPGAEPRRRPGRRIVVGALAVVVIALAVLLVSRHRNSVAATVRISPNSVAAIDPKVSRVVADVRLPAGATPESETAGFGRVWVGSQNGLISAVSPSRLRVQGSQGSSTDPVFMATGAGAVWAYDGKSRVTELAPGTMQVVADGPLWHCASSPTTVVGEVLPCTGGGVAVVGNDVWLGRGHAGFRAYSGGLVRYDAATLRQVGSVSHVARGDMVHAGGMVWSLGDGPADSGMELDGIPTATGSVAVRRVLPSPISITGGAGVSVGAGYVWAGSAIGVLYRIDPNPSVRASDAVFPYRMPPGIANVLAQPHDVWVAETRGEVLDVNPFNGHIKRSYTLGHVTPVALAAAGGRIWVAIAP